MVGGLIYLFCDIILIIFDNGVIEKKNDFIP